MGKAGSAVACVIFLLGLGPAAAQGWPPWADESFGNRRWGYERRPSWEGYDPVEPRERRALNPQGGDIRDGGARPEIAPQAPAVVSFLHDFPLNSIVIDTGGRKLYYVLPEGQAYEYAISVGREGFNWVGSETISRKQAWPDWHPPAEMRERDPALPEKMTGGLKNPLGAMALYLGNTLYRIHGTNDAKSIGRAASSGCFRILNGHVLHLASITEIGTTVNVVAGLPRRQEVSRAPEPVQVAPVPPASAERPPPEEQRQPEERRPPALSSPPSDYRALRDYTFGERR
jgi:lipoprotein-anchoring transpeptidase ErfK/SrfK